MYDENIYISSFALFLFSCSFKNLQCLGVFGALQTLSVYVAMKSVTHFQNYSKTL